MDVSEFRQIVDIFVQDTDEKLAQFEKLSLNLGVSNPSEQHLDSMCRLIKNLKGSAAALGFSELALFTHQLEQFLQSIKTRELDLSPTTQALLRDAQEFIRKQIEGLKSGKNSTGRGGAEALILAMQTARDTQTRYQVIELPRPPVAGDIWFVGDDLKAELFELPEIAKGEDEDHLDLLAINETKIAEQESMSASPIVAKIAAIQAEIARLTLLAAQVNHSTVQAATVQPEAVTVQPEAVTVQPEAVTVQPEAVTVQPEVVTVQPEVETSSSNADSNAEIFTDDTKHFSWTEQDSAAEISINTEQADAFIANTQAIQAAVISVTPAKLETSELHVQTVVQKNESEEDQEPNPEVTLPVTMQNSVSTPEDSVKVSLNRVDTLLRLINEMVILQGILDENRNEITNPLLKSSVSQMSKMVRELQEVSTSLRMVTLKPVFSKLQRLIRESALKLNKEVDGIFTGETTEIDKAIADQLYEPLAGLSRFIMESALENFEQRARSGKPRLGKLSMNVVSHARSINIEIRDDGKNITTETIRAKAIERGLMSAFEQLPEEKIRALIFHAGFASKTSDSIAGPGWSGLHETAAQVEALNGQIEFYSSREEGNCFRIILPRSITVIDGLVVKLGRERYVVAKSQVSETLRPHETDMKILHGQTEVINIRGQTLPLLHLSQLLKKAPPPSRPRATFDGVALLVHEDGKPPFALVVDDIITQQRVVIKPLGNELKNIAGLCGAAVLGDGKPAVILDLNELVNNQNNEKSKNKHGNGVHKAA